MMGHRPGPHPQQHMRNGGPGPGHGPGGPGPSYPGNMPQQMNQQVEGEAAVWSSI